MSLPLLISLPPKKIYNLFEVENAWVLIHLFNFRIIMNNVFSLEKTEYTNNSVLTGLCGQPAPGMCTVSAAGVQKGD